MTTQYEQARAIQRKFLKTEEDYREIVSLLKLAAEESNGLTSIQRADCYLWAAEIIFRHYKDKTRVILDEGVELLTRIERLQEDLPRWYPVYDLRLCILIQPWSFGFDECHAQDEEMLKDLAQKILDFNGVVEFTARIPEFFNATILHPYLAGHSESLNNNHAAIAVLNWMLRHSESSDDHFLYRGLVLQYCGQKGPMALEMITDNYADAIKIATKPKTPISYGVSATFAHYIDLLKRPQIYGFQDCLIDKISATLTEQKLERYKTDPSHRLTLFEMQILVNYDMCNLSTIGILHAESTHVQQAIELGKTLLAESDNDLVKMIAAATMGWIYQYKMKKTAEDETHALEYYMQVFSFKPWENDSIHTDLTNLQMTEEEVRKYNEFTIGIIHRRAIGQLMSAFYFPQQLSWTNVPTENISKWKESLHALGETESQFSIVRESFLTGDHFAKKFSELVKEDKWYLTKDLLFMSKVFDFHEIMIECEGNHDLVSRDEIIDTVIKELAGTVEVIDSSFHTNVWFYDFYQGYSTAFNVVFDTSRKLIEDQPRSEIDPLPLNAFACLMSFMPPSVGDIFSESSRMTSQVLHPLEHHAQFTTFTLLAPMLLEIITGLQKDNVPAQVPTAAATTTTADTTITNTTATSTTTADTTTNNTTTTATTATDTTTTTVDTTTTNTTATSTTTAADTIPVKKETVVKDLQLISEASEESRQKLVKSLSETLDPYTKELFQYRKPANSMQEFAVLVAMTVLERQICEELQLLTNDTIIARMITETIQVIHDACAKLSEKSSSECIVM